MQRYFNFSRLIKKYIGEFTPLSLSYGYYDDLGDWVKGESAPQTITGAIISHRESKIYRSEGTLTAEDKRLFTLEALDTGLINATVKYGDNIYRIEDCLDNSKFTGVWSYTMKYVSAFNKKRPEYDISDEIEDLEQRLDGVLVPDEPDTPDIDTDTDGGELLEKRLDGVE